MKVFCLTGNWSFMVQEQILSDLTNSFEVHLPEQHQQEFVRNQQQNQRRDLLP